MIPAADNLDARLRAHYTRESLDQDALARLRSLALAGGNEADHAEPPSPGRRRLRTAALVAAATLLLAALGLFVFQQVQHSGWRQLVGSNVVGADENSRRALSSSPQTGPMVVDWAPVCDPRRKRCPFGSKRTRTSSGRA